MKTECFPSVLFFDWSVLFVLFVVLEFVATAVLLFSFLEPFPIISRGFNVWLVACSIRVAPVGSSKPAPMLAFWLPIFQLLASRGSCSVSHSLGRLLSLFVLPCVCRCVFVRRFLLVIGSRLLCVCCFVNNRYSKELCSFVELGFVLVVFESPLVRSRLLCIDRLVFDRPCSLYVDCFSVVVGFGFASLCVSCFASVLSSRFRFVSDILYLYVGSRFVSIILYLSLADALHRLLLSVRSWLCVDLSLLKLVVSFAYRAIFSVFLLLASCMLFFCLIVNLICPVLCLP